MKALSVIFLLCTGLSGYLAAQDPATLHLYKGFRKNFLDGYCRVYEDVSGKKNIQDIIQDKSLQGFIPGKDQGFVYGFTDHVFWVNGKIKNPDSLTRTLTLELVNPNIDQLRLYWQSESVGLDSSQWTGIRDSFKTRPILHPNFQFQLTIKPRETLSWWLEIRPANASLYFKLLLWDWRERSNYASVEVAQMVIFFTIHLVFILLLALNVAITRFRYQWFFLICMLAEMMYVVADLGLGYAILWPKATKFQEASGFIFFDIYLLAALFFLRAHFSTQRFYPLAHRIIRSAVFLLVCWLVMMTFNLLMGWHMPTWLMEAHFWVFGIFILFILTLGGVALIREKSHLENTAFIVGFSIYGTTVMFTCFLNLGSLTPPFFGDFALKNDFLVPITFHTPAYLLAGMILQVVILFTVIALRFRRDYREKQLMIEELAAQKEKTLHALLLGQEQERQRIAQELHDGLGVQLSAMKMKLGAQPNADKSLLDDLDSAHEDVRSISRNLMSKTLSRLGLLPAIEDLTRQIQQVETRCNIRFIQNVQLTEFSTRAEINLFRIAQEMLNNAVRHALATEITLQVIQHDDSIIISCEDDGKGFDIAHIKRQNGIGLANLGYRASALNGKMSIDTSPGRGTMVSIELPIDSLRK